MLPVLRKGQTAANLPCVSGRPRRLLEATGRGPVAPTPWRDDPAIRPIVLDRVIESDPLSVFLRWWLVLMYFLSRRFDRLRDESARMIDIDPGHWAAHHALGLSQIATGQTEAAVRSFERAIELGEPAPRRPALPRALARDGTRRVLRDALSGRAWRACAGRRGQPTESRRLRTEAMLAARAATASGAGSYFLLPGSPATDRPPHSVRTHCRGIL